MFCYIGECIWLDLSLIERVVNHSRQIFPVVGFAFSSVPTYPCGTIGYVLASLNSVRCYNNIVLSGGSREGPRGLGPPFSLFTPPHEHI